MIRPLRFTGEAIIAAERSRDPLDFESYEEVLAAKGRLPSIGYASGDGAMVVHKGKHDACEHWDAGNPL